MMTARQRLLYALNGKATDRIPVNFYEIGGFQIDPNDPDPYNVYHHPSWRPLLDLAESKTDLIRMAEPKLVPTSENCRAQFFSERAWEQGGSRHTETLVSISGRTLRQQVRRDRDIHTLWVTEHLLKSPEDLQAFLELPDEVFLYAPDSTPMKLQEDALGERGLVMADTADPLCMAAALFSMEDYLAIAFTAPSSFQKLLEKFARILYPRVESVAAQFPGRLWRIYGPEYAAEPYLPPALFREFVVTHTGPMARIIQRHGGMARLHAHGRIRNLLPMFAEMGVDALDPIEPPPQGDITLRELRREWGDHFTFFGNIEIAAIENLASDVFECHLAGILREAVETQGKGFVLMPSSAPYGRIIRPEVLENYRAMVRLAHAG